MKISSLIYFRTRSGVAVAVRLSNVLDLCAIILLEIWRTLDLRPVELAKSAPDMLQGTLEKSADNMDVLSKSPH